MNADPNPYPLNTTFRAEEGVRQSKLNFWKKCRQTKRYDHDQPGNDVCPPYFPTPNFQFHP